MDHHKYHRKKVKADTLTTSVPGGYVLSDVVVSNTDTSLKDSDTFPNGEPAVTVNPTATTKIDITAFSSVWGGGDAAIFHSVNGGTKWTKDYSIPPPPKVPNGVGFGCPCDQTIGYSRGGALFGAFLNEDNQNGTELFSGDSTDPTSSSAWAWLLDGTGAAIPSNSASATAPDQPWLVIGRDPTVPTQDDTYVGYDDFGVFPVNERVAAAQGTAPPQFTRDQVIGAETSGWVNPGLRLATRASTVYGIWQDSHTQNADGSINLTYRINRSTNGGQTWSLNGSSNGIAVATANSDQPTPKFGTVNALLGGVDALAANQISGDVYYVYGTKDGATGKNRLAIRRLTTSSGVVTVGVQHFVSGQVQTALPSVAVANNGTVGVLYDTYNGIVNGFPQFTARLAQSIDQGATWKTVSLVTFLSPAVNNGDSRQRVLGDYQQMKAVGNTFYGVFSANGIGFGRSFANIDPVFLRAPAISPTDTSPPTFTKIPAPLFVVPTTLGAVTVPTTISWAATDPSGVCSYAVDESLNGGAFTAIRLASPTDTSVVRQLTPGNTYNYQVRATDCAGNISSPTPGTPFTIAAIQDTDPTITYAGHWTAQGLTSAYGGTVMFSSTSGDTASVSFTGTNIGFVSNTAPNRGSVSISLDGGAATILNLNTSTAKARQLLYSPKITNGGTHTLTVTVRGSSRIDVDAFITTT